MLKLSSLFFLVSFLCAAGVSAQDGFYLDRINLPDIMQLNIPQAAQDVPEAAPVAEKPLMPFKEWTVMVFINGKSNVEKFALSDMNELEAVGSSANVNVVAELGRMSGQQWDTDEDGNWTGTRRYYVRRDNNPAHITSPVLEAQKNADMGDWRRVADFVRWAKRNFPARRYMLVLWDHGWGWVDPKPESVWKNDKSISHDFQTGNFIRTAQLGKIFKSAGRVDFYASMACFMQMAEVAYEIKDYADVIVGSEEIIQLPSFDFTGFLALLTANPYAGPEAASVYLLDTFKALYSRPEQVAELEKNKYGVQLSAIRPGRLNALPYMLNNWTKLVMEVNDTAAVKAAKDGVVRFEVGDENTDPQKKISFYGDLYTFVQILARNINPDNPASQALKQQSAALLKYVANELVIKNVYGGRDRTGKDYRNTHGLGIHIPGAPGTLLEYTNSYNDLSFGRSSSWAQFIRYLQQVN